MPEGLSEAELSNAIAEHAEAVVELDDDRPDRWLSIAEAVLLSLVAVLAAYSGFAAAKWGTDSSVALARASSQRTQASRDAAVGLVTRTLDAATFNAWFTAFTMHDKRAEQLAIRRLRPGYRVAFDAWLATNPVHNPNAPPGPAYMPQYVIPAQHATVEHDARADADYAHGERAGANSDDYIRDTVFLATVLFLIGISTHFHFRKARIGLVAVGTAMLLFSVIQLLTLAGPP
ncbi:MAG TPA: hypothetical protein VGG87_08000 [Solirubrobacteraceae bacterium]